MGRETSTEYRILAFGYSPLCDRRFARSKSAAIFLQWTRGYILTPRKSLLLSCGHGYVMDIISGDMLWFVIRY